MRPAGRHHRSGPAGTSIGNIRPVRHHIPVGTGGGRQDRFHAPAPRDTGRERLTGDTEPGGGLAHGLLAGDPCDERAELGPARRVPAFRDRAQPARIAPPPLGAGLREPVPAHRAPAQGALPRSRRLVPAHRPSQPEKSSTPPDYARLANHTPTHKTPVSLTADLRHTFLYLTLFSRFHGIMWAKCGQKSSPRSPLPQRENGPDRQVGRLGLSRLRCRAGPNCAWWSCGEVEALFDGADADERAGEDAERVERGHYRVHVSPAPCGADRTDEQGECGQDDEAQPFEDVVDAAGDCAVGFDPTPAVLETAALPAELRA